MSEIIASTYEIIRELGAGGGGVVYLANHMRLKKKVILKADKRKITTRSDLLRREVDVLKELRHTYIPQVYDYFIDNDTVYTVIDYIDGESLDKPLERGERFSQVQVIVWARELLEALKYLHSPIHGTPPRGYVHSDIKPANIMRRQNNDICLIDFNIALALGEENAIGCSKGYASPEHYGLDFSSGSSDIGDRNQSGTEILTRSRVRRTSTRDRSISTGNNSSGMAGKKKIIPDVRSDIYSLGATLYHLLSGKRPEKDAKEVVPLSKKEFSAQLVDIITKAMNPNPDLRYQTAEEMLYAFLHLHENDARAVWQKRRNLAVYTVLSFALTAGIISSFVGLQRIQTTERWLRMTKEAQEILQNGDRTDALRKVMQVYEEQDTMLAPEPTAETQRVLTDILDVYDVSDRFSVYRTVSLPSAPLELKIAPDAKTAVCICFGSLEIVDLESAAITASLSTEKSALAEAEYLDEHTLVYAGVNGITAYDISEERELWKGEKATGIAVSGDKSTVASVYRDENQAFIYDARTGEQKYVADFAGKSQNVSVNDAFINPTDNLFCMNEDGSMLALSFSDGSLSAIDLTAEDSGIIKMLDNTEGYNHYEGGFYRQYLAFAAANGDWKDSAFAVMDMEQLSYMRGFHSEGYYFTHTNENGIVVGIDNSLVKMEPVTGEQLRLVNTIQYINQYDYDGSITGIASGSQISFFDSNAKEIGMVNKNSSCDLLAVQGNTAIAGSLNDSELWILRYNANPETQTAVYDATFRHKEARVSPDGEMCMLFSASVFRLSDKNGNVTKEVQLPNVDNIYDQQYIRDGTAAYLEITYYDGCVQRYSAIDGSLLSTEQVNAPDKSLYEEFETDHYRVESQLHGGAKVFSKDTGKLVTTLEEDGYLTYFSEAGDYLIAQYRSTDDRFCGYLLDRRGQVLAYLPNLCDVMEDSLFFDYPTGSIRNTKIYDLNELLNLAHRELEEVEKNES